MNSPPTGSITGKTKASIYSVIVLLFIVLTGNQILRYRQIQHPEFFSAITALFLVLAAILYFILPRAGMKNSGSLQDERDHYWILLFITLAGFAVRIINLGNMPPGLWLDEAHNGLDAIRAIETGIWPVFFPANTGREPLFLWMIEVSIRLLGPTIEAIRIPACLIGTLMIPAIYFTTRVLTNRSTALWAAFFIACARWPLTFSRLGFRTLLIPLFGCIIVGLLSGPFVRYPKRIALGAGVFLGMGFYTAIPFRIFPVAAFIILTITAWKNLKFSHYCMSCAILLIASLATAAPLGYHFYQNPELFAARIETTSVFDGSLQSILTIAKNFIDLLGMMHLKGDGILRHNFFGLPLADPLTGICIIAGLKSMMAHARSCRILLVWGCVSLIPAAVAVTWTGPHSLRSLGALPVFIILGASGLHFLIRILDIHKKTALMGFILTAISAWNFYFYFYLHQQRIVSIDLKYDAVWGFSVRETRLSRYLMDRAAASVEPVTTVYLSPQLFFHATIQYLKPTNLHLLLIDSPRIEPLKESQTGNARWILDLNNRNMFWLRNSSSKRFFDYWKYRYGMTDEQIERALQQCYIPKTGFNNTADFLIENGIKEKSMNFISEDYARYKIYTFQPGDH